MGVVVRSETPYGPHLLFSFVHDLQVSLSRLSFTFANTKYFYGSQIGHLDLTDPSSLGRLIFTTRNHDRVQLDLRSECPVSGRVGRRTPTLLEWNFTSL